MDDAILITGILIAALVLLRNHLAGSWGIRACCEAHELNCADLYAGRDVDIDVRYDAIPSHEALMFDLTQWRYRSPFKTE